jgi:mitochondrial intermembrane space import and assembly protein 40
LINEKSRKAQETRQNRAAELPLGTAGEPGPADEAIEGVGELEEEAQGQGAFNPETGEINWDCPCLGGMADGPCGPQFKEAFSCFVFSTEEPKGMDCIEKFQGMRDCFAEHPEHYKDELMEDEEIDRELETERQELVNQIAERQKADEDAGHRLLEEPVAPSKAKTASSSSSSGDAQKPTKSVESRSQSQKEPAAAIKATTRTSPTVNADQGDAVNGQGSETVRESASFPASTSTSSETDLVPKAAHDARHSVGPGGKQSEN